MIKNNKLIRWFVIVNFLYFPMIQADSSSNITWEHYIPFASLSMITGAYVYSLLSPCQDLKNQSQCRYWIKDFNDSCKIYYPHDTTFFYDDEVQLIANETQIPVLVIIASHVKHDSDKIDQLFEQAQLLAPCIIYIEKDMTCFTALPFYDFNEFIDDSTGIFRSSCAKLMDQLKKLQKYDESIIVLGIGKDHDRQSIYDIVKFSFNIIYECPSCKERIEFLQLLLAKRSYTNIDIKKLAKKTIGFSYKDLINLVQKAERHALASYIQSICNNDIDKAFKEIVDNHDIVKYITNESMYETCIHEMGHAIMAAHFHEDFILHNATSTPQFNVDNPKDNVTLGLMSLAEYCNIDCQIDRDKKDIMIDLAGKISEQIFFGLSGWGILNSQTGYRDFVLHPDGAEHDLNHARVTAYKICKTTYGDPDELLKELYEAALELLISYKDIIEKGAKLLEQNEFVTGSQVYNLIIK